MWFRRRRRSSRNSSNRRWSMLPTSLFQSLPTWGSAKTGAISSSRFYLRNLLYHASMRLSITLFVLLLPASVLAQQNTLLLWPNGNPEPSKVVGPEIDPTTDANRIVSGKVAIRVTNVSKPSLAVYSPDPAKNNGAAALVFPGGGYIRLSYNLEGTEVCDWLNSLGMTCVLVKYRVPEKGHYTENVEDLEDAQQAIRLTRAHASEWHIDPKRIGVIGFSAGAHLAAVLSTDPD